MNTSGIIFQRKIKRKKTGYKKSDKPVLRNAKSSSLSGYYPNLYPLTAVFLVLMVIVNWIVADNINIAGLLANIPVMGLSPTPTLSPTPAFTPTPTPTPLLLPSALVVEKIGIEAEVDYVGAVDGKMANPASWERVAWFSPSSPPGSPGNTVIAGHYDTNRGTPAVFYNLDRLEAGDLIKLYTEDSSEFVYRVEGKEVYPYNEAPLDYIFAGDGTARLVLVTCEGQFFNSINTYSHRIVIYSQLI